MAKFANKNVSAAIVDDRLYIMIDSNGMSKDVDELRQISTLDVQVPDYTWGQLADQLDSLGVDWNDPADIVSKIESLTVRA